MKTRRPKIQIQKFGRLGQWHVLDLAFGRLAFDIFQSS